MIILGYIGAVAMGVVLGLMGGGGAILTVPILIYFFHISPSLAVNYSLFIVGVSSLFGVYNHWKMGNIRWDVIPRFGIASIIGVLLAKKILFPIIPQYLFSIGALEVSKDKLTIWLFAILMVLASDSMIRKNSSSIEGQKVDTFTSKIQFLLYGLVVGGVTGLLGAGGGFLIIPALILLSKLSMKNAVATSLVIIAINALIGFFSTVSDSYVDWYLLGKVCLFAFLGIFLGVVLSKKVSNEKLRPSFGWFVLVMGFLVIYKELF